jgi:uncharacterized protein involved in exopolysaccharide biosynthesis
MTLTNSRAHPIESPIELSLREIVTPLFRRKTLLITTFLSTLGIIVLAGVVMPPPFKSHMAVLVNRERLDPFVTTESTTQIPSNSSPGATVEEINSEAALLLSQDLLSKVVLSTRLDNQRSFSLSWLFPKRSEEERVDGAVRRLAKKLVVKTEPNSNLIDVSYSSSDPKLSYAILDSLANFYIEKHLEVHRPPGSFEFFANETQKYQDALKQSELNLRNFSHQENVAAPDVVRTYLAQTLATSMGQLNTIQQLISADKERIRSDKDQMQQTPQRLATREATSPADKLIEDLTAALVAAQTKRTQLALKYDPTYPLVQEADQEILQMKAAIEAAEKTRYVTQNTDVDPTYELLREDLARTQADLATQRASAVGAMRGIQSMREQMVKLDQQALTQQDLLRNAKANEDNYLLYLGKREQERTADALDKTRIGNVMIAVPPTIPALPVYSLPIVIVAALGIALILSIGLAYTVDYCDPSIHSPAEIINILDIPVVVSMPKKTA